MKNIEILKGRSKWDSKLMVRFVGKSVVKLYKASNLYFFGEEEISLHDFCWFYGSLSFMASLIFIIKVLSMLLY